MPMKSLLEKLRSVPAAAPSLLPYSTIDLAVAALLIEAAQVDGSIPAAERRIMQRLVREHLQLPAEETAQLLEIAEGEFAAALDDWVFTQTVRQHYATEERLQVLGMMWRVVYADGRLARLEDALLGRTAAALGLTPAQADAARALAYARLNARDGGGE
jgi:uncharacterized tellurite resistance protein B-like protein